MAQRLKPFNPTATDDQPVAGFRVTPARASPNPDVAPVMKTVFFSVPCAMFFLQFLGIFPPHIKPFGIHVGKTNAISRCLGLHGLKTARELAVGGPQRIFGIDSGLSRQLRTGKEQIPDFLANVRR